MLYEDGMRKGPNNPAAFPGSLFPGQSSCHQPPSLGSVKAALRKVLSVAMAID